MHSNKEEKIMSITLHRNTLLFFSNKNSYMNLNSEISTMESIEKQHNSFGSKEIIISLI